MTLAIFKLSGNTLY